MDELTDRRDLPIFIHSELDDYGLTSRAFRVYAHLARRAGRGGAFPSYASIGKVCFSPDIPEGKEDTWRRQAIQAVKELVDAGLIRKEVRKDSEGNHTSNLYGLTPRSMWGGSDGGPLPSDGTALGGSDGGSLPSDGGSPKGTPLEGTPLEGSPKKNDDRPAAKNAGDRDGRMLLALIQQRGFIYTDSQAPLLAVKLEDEYTDAELRKALDSMTTQHQKLIKTGKRGITAPLAYLRSVLVGMDDKSASKNPLEIDWDEEMRKYEAIHGKSVATDDDESELPF